MMAKATEPAHEEKPLHEHLVELLTVLRKALIAVLVAAGVSSALPANLIPGLGGDEDSLYVPLVSVLPRLMVEGVLPSTVSFAGREYEVKLIYTSPFEGFTVTLYSAIMMGLLVSSPYVAYQLYQYVKPALYPHEDRALKRASLAAASLFVLGACVAYFVITPIALRFLFLLQAAVAPEGQLLVSTSLNQLFSFIVKLVVATGFAFEVPLVIYFMLSAGVLTPDTFKGDKMKYAFVVILVISALISPDPTGLGMLILAVPYYALFYAAVKLGVRKYEEKYGSQGLTS